MQSRPVRLPAGPGGLLLPGDPEAAATVRWLFETYATTDISMQASPTS